MAGNGYLSVESRVNHGVSLGKWEFALLHMATVWLYPHVVTLTFLLPSVTTRGTGMGGHLLRWGGGFSLFHTMMICKGAQWSSIRLKTLNRVKNIMFPGNSWCTCEQYFDFDTTCRSFIIGWDWETSWDVAWMTAVNSWPGMTPALMEDREDWDCDRKLRLWSRLLVWTLNV